ncbi:MAG: hypothetical protein ABIJ09_03875 [Pseudomonadota bacterium]
MTPTTQAGTARILPVAVLGELAIAACVVLWLGIAALHPPAWGLMDDHNHLFRECPAIAHEGFFSFYLGFLRHDLVNREFVRIIYPLQVILQYCHQQPWLAALFSLLVTLSGTWLFFFWCARLLEPRLLRTSSPTARFVAALGTLSCLAFLWFQDFLLQWSLQEKFVLLALAPVCWILFSARVQSMRPVPFTLVSAALIGFGLAIKGQFAIALPLVIGWQLVLTRRSAPASRSWRVVVLCMLGAVGGLALKISAARSPYASRYTVMQGVQNLLQWPALLVVIPMLAVAIHAIVLWRQRQDRPAAIVQGSLALCLAAYLVVLGPVGWRYYVLAFAAPWLALPWVLWVCAGSRRVQLAVLGVTAALALVVTGHRTSRVLTGKNDIHRIAASPVLAELARSSEALHVPCEEGSVAMRRYIDEAQGAAAPTVLGPGAQGEGAPTATVWFFDDKNCPLSALQREWAGRPLEVLVAPSFPGGFTVQRLGPPRDPP